LGVYRNTYANRVLSGRGTSKGLNIKTSKISQFGKSKVVSRRKFDSSKGASGRNGIYLEIVSKKVISISNYHCHFEVPAWTLQSSAGLIEGMGGIDKLYSFKYGDISDRIVWALVHYSHPPKHCIIVVQNVGNIGSDICGQSVGSIPVHLHVARNVIGVSDIEPIRVRISKK